MAFLQDVLKPRSFESRKGDFGRIMVIGGSPQYVGAPALVGMAAIAAGADIVNIFAPEKVAWTINAMDPSLITTKLDGERLTPEHVQDLLKRTGDFDVLVIGNGLGAAPETVDAVAQILSKVKIPTVVDADAFKAKVVPKKGLLTPHSKEFETMFRDPLPKDLEKRRAKVAKHAAANKCVILLKGGIDIISDGKKTAENRVHNPEMTVGGTGDTLAGICAAFLAQSNGKAFESARAAAWVNGTAGDLCLKKRKRVLPHWLIEYIPESLQLGIFQ